MKSKNIKEFKALILRYETVTLEEIKATAGEVEDFYDVAQCLTGFGSQSTCTLCEKGYSCFDDCSACLWYKTYPMGYFTCGLELNRKTYLAIKNVQTPRQLFNAFRARAKHMRKTLKKLKIKQP